jgi:hypothetical protein
MLQDFKLCSTLINSFSVHVERNEQETELNDVQCDSTLKQKLSDATAPNFNSYLYCQQMPN